MIKTFNFLSLFGDDETLEQKIARVEKALEEKDNKIKELEDTNKELEKQVKTLKLDGLVKKVEPTPEVKEEEITFDFDM